MKMILTSSHLRQRRTAPKAVALNPLESVQGHAKHNPLGRIETLLPSVIKSKVNVKVG